MIELSKILSSIFQTRVSILDNDTKEELFDSIDVARVAVSESKRPTKFAVEDGTERSDHIVTELTEIQIDFTITNDLRDTFLNIRQAYLSHKLVTIQTKVMTYENMLISNFPHDESSELGISISSTIRLQEWKEVLPEYGEMPESKVENKKQSDTVKRGQQTSTQSELPAEKSGSVAGSWDIFGKRKK